MKATSSEDKTVKRFTIIVLIAIVLTAIITAVIVKKFSGDEASRKLTPQQKENIEQMTSSLKEYYMNKYK
ncbi:MAG: hypothetical protein WC045_00600 [Patescibacteria group bacterium]